MGKALIWQLHFNWKLQIPVQEQNQSMAATKAEFSLSTNLLIF